jgi:hypothetical protein
LARDNEHLFRQRLRERFGLRSEEFSEELLAMFHEFWRDGVESGRWWPNPVPANDTFRKLCILRHFGDRCAEFSHDLRGLLVELWTDALDYGKGEMCARCGSREGVEMESARTAYEPTEKDPDPNADIPYCRSCAEEHHEHWDEMWAEYYAGRL